MSKNIHLNPRVATAFYGQFRMLREAQQAAIEPILDGRNLILSSGTGSGKTEAVMAPLIDRYWREAIRTDSIVMLYIAPTKALVNDLEKRLYKPLYVLGLQIGVRHGDRDDLVNKRRIHVLVTTPESLEVMLFRKDAALSNVRAVVIDEVHLLYNTQRGLQLSILLQRLKERLGAPLQYVALSATISDLSDVHFFLAGVDEMPVCLPYPSHRAIETQIRYVASEVEFLNLISKITEGRPTKLLVFTNSRRECERLASVLKHEQLLKHNVFTHYSSLSSEVRLDIEMKFASSNTAICLATSTLELGIDIGDIDAVLLWGVPDAVETFLQRIGRSNRRANKTNVICLIPDSSKSVNLDALCFAALMSAASKNELSRRQPYELYGAVAQQILSIIASDEGRFTRIADLCQIVEHKPYLDRQVVESILAQLAAKGYLQHHGFKNQYGAKEMLYNLVDLKLIYGNFGTSSQTVDLYHGDKHLGDVPATNLLRIHQGSNVRFAGRIWQVQKVLREKILLHPSQSDQVMDFTYKNGGVEMDIFVVNRIWQLIHASEFPEDLFTLSLRHIIGEFRSRLCAVCSFHQIPYVLSNEGIQYFTFAGYLVNKAIGLLLCKDSFKASHVFLSVSSSINWTTIPSDPTAFEEIFPDLFEPSSNQSLFQSLLPLELQLHERKEEWLKDQAVTDALSRLSISSPVMVDPACFSFIQNTE